MSGPWEKYQQQSQTPASGPWAKYQQTPEANPEGSFVSNLAADAKDVGRQVMGAMALPKQILLDAPMQAARSIRDVARGVPISETEGGQAFGDTMDTFAAAPREIVKRGVEIVSDPIGSFYRKPITTALDVGTAVVPAARGAVNAGARMLPAVAERVVPSAVRAADKLVPKALGMAFSAPEDALKYRMAEGKAVDAAVPYSQLADELPGTLNKLGEKLTEQTKGAKKILRSTPYLMEGATPKDDVISIIRGQKRGLRVKGSIVGEPQQAAVSKLDDLASRVERIRGETISERDVRKIVEQLDPRIWSQEPEIIQQRVRGVRVRLDHLIKNQNPEFRKAMVPVAKNTRLMKNIRREFALKEEAGNGLVPTPATTTKFQSILQDRNTVYQRRMAELNRETGVNYLKKAKDYSVQKQLTGGETNGSRNTLGLATVGAAAGGVVAGPVGSSLGAAAGGLLGRIVDKRGREIASRLIDSYMKIRPNATVGDFLKANPDVVKMINIGKSVKEASTTPRKILAKKPEKILTEKDAKAYLKKAKGDRPKARRMAIEEGWTIPE